MLQLLSMIFLHCTCQYVELMKTVQVIRVSSFFLFALFCSPHSVHKSHAGESEKILREAFDEAAHHATSGKPAVIFIDEIDALCPRRDSRYS